MSIKIGVFTLETTDTHYILTGPNDGRDGVTYLNVEISDGWTDYFWQLLRWDETQDQPVS